MTDSELQTVREWCKANGVKLIRSKSAPGYFCFDRTPGYLGCIGYRRTRKECYERVWESLAPIIQSIRNLDAVEVPGPYKVQPWKVREGVQYYCVTNSMSFDYFADMSEQTARRIAAILNRECWDGK